MSRPRSFTLARVVKIYLDISWVLLIVLSVMFVLGLVLSMIAAPRIDPPPNLTLPLRFSLGDGSQMFPFAPGKSEAIIPLTGQGDLMVHTSSRAVVAYMFTLHGTWLIVALIVTRNLRLVFRAVAARRPFAVENPRRVRVVGFAVMIWAIFQPLLEYFGSALIIDRLIAEGVTLRPPISFNIEGLFFGLALVVLGEIAHQATRLHDEQSLTV